MKHKLTKVLAGTAVTLGILLALGYFAPVPGFETRAAALDSTILAQCQAALTRTDLTEEQKTWAESCIAVLGGPPASPTPTPLPTVTGSTPSPSPSPVTPTPSPSSSPTATSTPGGGSTNWPSANTTGVPPFAALTPFTGDCSIRANNVVISNKTFSCKVTVIGTNVTINNSRFLANADTMVLVSGSLTVNRSTFEPSSGCYAGESAISGRSYQVYGSKVLHLGEGFWVTGPNVTIQDNYVLACTAPGAHSDIVQGYHGGAGVVIRHNHFDQRLPADVTAPIFWGDDSGTGLLVENNLLRGGTYTIRIHSGFGHTVRNNVIDRAWIYGPVNSRCQGIIWTNNRVATVSDAQVLTNVASQPCVGNA